MVEKIGPSEDTKFDGSWENAYIVRVNEVVNAGSGVEFSPRFLFMSTGDGRSHG